MERVKKSKVKPTLESIVFATPEQKLLRFLLSESTTSFSPRVLSSKLKGVRGLGGAEGIQKILNDLAELGVVQWVNNNREVSLQNDHLTIQMLKKLSSVCDLEGLQIQVAPVSRKGVLFGSRATGEYRTDSNYDLFVVTDTPEEVEKIVARHPLGRRIELTVKKSDEALQIEIREPQLHKKLNQGIVMWGPSW